MQFFAAHATHEVQHDAEVEQRADDPKTVLRPPFEHLCVCVCVSVSVCL